MQNLPIKIVLIYKKFLLPYKSLCGKIRYNNYKISKLITINGGKLMKIKESFLLKEVAGEFIVVPVGESLVDFSAMIVLN